VAPAVLLAPAGEAPRAQDELALAAGAAARRSEDLDRRTGLQDPSL